LEPGSSAMPKHKIYDEMGEDAWNLMDKSERKQAVEVDDSAADSSPMFPNFGDDDEEPPARSSLDISRLLGGIWNRRWLVTVIASVIILLFTTLALTSTHHMWKAQISLINVANVDKFTVGKFGEPFKPQAYSLDTMLDTVKLPSVLEKTIQRSGIDTAPRKLATAIDVVVGKESKIFQMIVTWDDPSLAAAISNNLASVFIENNKAMRRKDAEDVFHYYGGQMQDAKKKLDQINAEILRFQTSHGIINFKVQSKVKLTKISDLEVEYQGLLSEVKSMQETKKLIDQNIESSDELIVQSAYYRNPLKKKLAELEWSLTQAKGRYTEKNPKVIDLLQRIHKIKQMVESGADKSAPENTYAANPIRQALMLRRYKLIDELDMKQSRIVALKKMIADKKQSLTLLNSNQKDFSQLLTKQASVQRLLDNLNNRVEESRIVMLSGQHDFAIVERATIPDQPESSGRKIILIAGVVLGVVAGILVALLLEFFDPYLRTRREAMGLADMDMVVEFQEVPDWAQKVVDISSPNEPVALMFRRMLNDLQVQLVDDVWESLAIVSVEKRAGKSLLLTNLAQAFSMKEESVLLVDADLSADASERPGDLFELKEGNPGLLQLLSGKVSIREVLQQTESKGVMLMPASVSSDIEAHASVNLGGKSMQALINKLKDIDMRVLYDLPALDECETAFEAARSIAHVILILHSGHSKKADVKRVVERLKTGGVEIHAVILSNVPANLMQTELQFIAPDGAEDQKKNSEEVN